MNEEMNENVQNEELKTETQNNEVNTEVKIQENEQTNVETKKPKTSKKYKGLMILFIILLVILAVLFGLMKAGILKKVNLIETHNNKVLMKAFDQTIKEKPKASMLKFNVKYDGLEEKDKETKKYLDMISKVVNSIKIETVSIEKGENELEKAGLKIKSYNDEIISVIFDAKGADKYIGEKALLDLGVKLDEDTIDEILENYKKYAKESNSIYEILSDVISSSKEISKQIKDILDINKKGEEIEVSIKEEVSAEKLKSSMDAILKEIKEDEKLNEKTLKLINRINELSNDREDEISKEEFNKEIEEVLDTKKSKSELEEMEEALKSLKGQKIIFKLSNNVIKQIKIKISQEEILSEELKLSADIIIDFVYDKNEAEKILPQIDKNNIFDQKDLESNNDLGEKVDLEKIKNKVLNFKILKELGITKNTLNDSLEALENLIPFMNVDGILGNNGNDFNKKTNESDNEFYNSYQKEDEEDEIENETNTEKQNELQLKEYESIFN